MNTTINKAWSEEYKCYMILGATIELSVIELLAVTKGLMMVKDDADTHPDDKAKAEELLKDIHERLGE